jgi:hypothetical protein
MDGGAVPFGGRCEAIFQEDEIMIARTVMSVALRFINATIIKKGVSHG